MIRKRRPAGRSRLIALVILVPVVLTEALQITLRVLPVPQPAWPETSAVSEWIANYGFLFVLINIGIGSIFLFRAFRALYVVPMLVAYVPMMVLLIQFVGLAVAGIVFQDYL